MAANDPVPDAWLSLEQAALEYGELARRERDIKYFDKMPAQVAYELKLIDRTLSTALQVLAGLDLEHEPDQDIETRPFNHPVVIALHHGRVWPHLTPVDPAEAGQSIMYPDGAIKVIREFRDAARRAAGMTRPKPGNSADRTEQTRCATWVGRNFVWLYRRHIGNGELPPVSQTGPAVDVLRKMLCAAGLQDLDPVPLLKRSVRSARSSLGI